MSEKKCVTCGGTENLKRGWTNSLYCSEGCERRGVSDLHASMPGAGPVPRQNWVPSHISTEISKRWKEEE